MLRAMRFLAGLTGCIAAASAYASTCVAPLSNWGLVQRVPDQAREHPLNVIDVETEGVLRWNGTAVTEAQVQSYLRVVTKMNSSNITVLKAHPEAPCVTVARVRQLMNDVLGCDSNSCAEVVN